MTAGRGRVNVEVRALNREADLPAIVDLHNDRSVVYGTLQIPFASQDFWAARLESDWATRFLVATVDGFLVGAAGFHVGSERTVRSGTLGMAVRGEYQGRGVGKALMEAIVDLADNWYNLRRLELEVYADNAAGIALYKKFGFEPEGLYRRYAFRDGQYVDALPMARLRPDNW